MDQFAVFHITKFKDLGGIGAHIDRKHIASNVNEAKTDFNETLLQVLGSTIDSSKTHLREEWATSSENDLRSDVKARIDAGYRLKRNYRHDAVLALGVIMTGSHERMKEIEADPKLFDAWKKANYAFACHEFGKENIVRFTLHRDERTPHFHCVFVPITPEGRLSAKYFTDGSKQFKAYQDRYAEAMKPFGLSRGIPKELTNREHVSTEDYYREVEKLAIKTRKATEGIKRSNLFQLDTVRHKLSERITQLETTALHHRQQVNYVNLTNKKLMNEEQRTAYRERLIEESRTAHTWIKQEIPLIDFAVDRLGWQVNKKKTTKKEVVLRHERHGTILVRSSPRPDTGHWVFNWPNQTGGKGGTLIDLLRLESWEWDDIKALAGQVVAHRPVAALPALSASYEQQTEKDPMKQTAYAQKRFDRFKATEGTSYLERRGIEKSMYEGAPQLKVNKEGVIFKLYNVVKDKAHLCSTAHYYYDKAGNSEHYFQKALPRGLAVLREVGPVERIVVAESPVDALSWKQVEALQSQNPEAIPRTMCVCTCGNLTSSIRADISFLFAEARKKGQSVVLARDNDEAGVRISSGLAALADEQGVVTRMSSPPEGCKDWNDYLRDLRKEMAEGVQQGKEAGKTVEVPQLARTTTDAKVVDKPMKEVLSKAPGYKGSLLEELEIPEKACKGLRGYESMARQVTFPLYTSGPSVREQQPVGSYQIRLEEGGLRSYHEVSGTTPGLVVLPAEKPAKSVVITSSPLDIFLHRAEQQRSDITYISTCGQDAKDIKAPLKALLDEHQGKHVLLYMNDKSAQALQKQLAGEPGKAANYTVQKPQEASWHHTFDEIAYDMKRILRQEEEQWEPIKPKRRKGKGRRLRAMH